MKITKIDSINYTGIKLANPSYEYASKLSDFLASRDVYVSGHKSFNIANEFMSKRNVFDYIRDKYYFYDNECGIVFLPKANETWIISRPAVEQRLLELLKKAKIKAEINLGM